MPSGMSDEEFDRRMADYLIGTIEKIKEHGWVIQGVFGDKDEPPFAYTVGLAGRGLPELIVSGLPMGAAQPVLNDLARRAVDGIARLEHGARFTDLLANEVPMRLIGTDYEAAKAETGVARNVQIIQTGDPHAEIEVLQLLWPDKEGRWPGDEGFVGAQDLWGQP